MFSSVESFLWKIPNCWQFSNNLWQRGSTLAVLLLGRLSLLAKWRYLFICSLFQNKSQLLMRTWLTSTMIYFSVIPKYWLLLLLAYRKISSLIIVIISIAKKTLKYCKQSTIRQIRKLFL